MAEAAGARRPAPTTQPVALQRSLVVVAAAGPPGPPLALSRHTAATTAVDLPHSAVMSNTPPPPPPPPGPPGQSGAPLPPPGAAAPPPSGAATATATGWQPAPLPSGELATFGPRFGGWLLDGILYGLLAAVFAVPGVIAIVSAFSDCVTIDDEIICPPGEPDAGRIALGIVLIVIGAIVTFVLYVRALSRTGQTWGRKIVGVRVVDERTGAPLGTGKALGRTLFAWIISSNVLYLGYLWMLWDDRNQTWHDKVVGSVVVRA